MNFCLVFDATTGEIKSVSNVLPENSNWLEISKEKYLEFVRNELDYGDYLVAPDPAIKGQFQLVEKNKSKTEFDVTKSIHEFEKTNISNQSDILYIIQDKNDKKWKASANLNTNYISFLNQTKNFSESIKRIYVTTENNPNILLDVLEIDLKNFLENKEFEIKDLESTENVSLYAAVTHETYKHVIRE